MHDFSLATEVVDELMAIAHQANAKKISKVELLVGELTLLGEERFAFWVKEILKGKGTIGCDTQVNFIPVAGRECVLNKVELET